MSMKGEVLMGMTLLKIFISCSKTLCAAMTLRAEQKSRGAPAYS